MRNKRVLLGMSGGVDSSMAAWFLLHQGYEVIGITFNTIAPLASEKSLDFINEAKNLAAKFNFKHIVLDVYEDFHKHVVKYFIDEYTAGRTPNPCIRCNETIKWKLLYQESQKLDCDFISTGHYVNTIEKNGFYHIKKGVDPQKDQSYFLWNLPQPVLKKCIFPLGSLLKNEVKAKASELGILTKFQKKESMGICFLRGRDYRDFLLDEENKEHSNISKGLVINSKGESIGIHEGIALYTIGQKRGLQLHKKEGEYVAFMNPDNNTITTAPKDKLFSRTLEINNFSFCNPNYLLLKKNVDIRIRGLDCVPPTPGTIELINNKLIVHFSQLVWAITPGQSIVFYEDSDVIVGGGIVNEVVYD